MSSTITMEIVDYILMADPPPDEVRQKAVEHIIDGVGVILAGSRTECAHKLADFVRMKGSTGPSTLLGFGLKAHPSDAALVNGTSGHADDYDDTQLSMSPDRIYGLLTHPTVPALAAALAVAEDVGCSGRKFLDAFIAGFEVECKIAEAVNPEHYMRGFHTTGTVGAFGACAASSKLLKLDEESVRHALGITASLSSGIRANFGTMTKPLHAGMAAYNGVVAAVLAERGFTADRDALDGRWGFMKIIGHGADPDRIVGKLGRPYSIVEPGASIKMYPCGSLGQPSMDALLEIVLNEDLSPSDVREVRVRAGPNILEPLRYQRPISGLEAKFSLNFGLASILLWRRAGLREYTTEVVNSPEVVEAIGRIKTVLDSEVADMGTDKMRSIVEVELQDGKVLSRFADTARGTPEKPISKEELDEKFRDCVSLVLEVEKIGRILETIRGIEGVFGVDELTALL
jgi:2-methylcitrate dehydratase PrpD